LKTITHHIRNSNWLADCVWGATNIFVIHPPQLFYSPSRLMGSRFVVLLAGITSSAWTRWASALKASKSRGITGTAIEVYGLLLAQEVSERLKREAALVDEGAFRNVQVTPIDQQMLAQVSLQTTR
jgi:hypothetical protein